MNACSVSVLHAFPCFSVVAVVVHGIALFITPIVDVIVWGGRGGAVSFAMS